MRTMGDEVRASTSSHSSSSSPARRPAPVARLPPSRPSNLSRDLCATNDLPIVPDNRMDGLNRTNIGRGSYGQVVKYKYKNDNGEWINVAVKFANGAGSLRTALIKECKLLHAADHENVVKVYGLYYCPVNDVGMVLEFMDCKNLGELLRNTSITYRIDHAVSWLYQLSKGIGYFHSQDPPIIHRDLKAQNFLLCDRYRHLKICDFGTFTDVRSTMTGNRGTPYTMAPEVFKCEQYSEKADIFSLGICIWQVLARREPYDNAMYQGQAVALLYNVSMRNIRPPELMCDPLLSTFYKRCWQENPDDRPHIDEVIRFFAILVQAYPGGTEPLIDSSTNQPVSTPQPNVPRPAFQKHRRGGSDQTTLLKPEAIHPTNTISTAVSDDPQRTNRSHSVVAFQRSHGSADSTNTSGASSREHSQQPVNVLDSLPPQLRPPNPIVGDAASERTYNDHMAYCHQLHQIDQEARKQLEKKHEALSRLEQLHRYRKLLEKKRTLQAIRDDAFKHVQQHS